MADRDKVLKGLECCSESIGHACPLECPYRIECLMQDDTSHMYSVMHDALELLKEQNAIVDALLKVGYPHNFQREEPWIVNYMLNITDVVRKAINLRNAEEVKQDENIS